MSGQADPGLRQAWSLSRRIMEAAENSDMLTVSALDAERIRLVRSYRLSARAVSAADQALLREITALNDRAIGLVEHHRRSKARQMDMAAVGRRAVAAYAGVRLQR